MSLVLQSINLEDLDKAKKYYPDYINTFYQKSGTAGNYIAEMKTWVGRQVNWMKNSVDYWSERNKWGIVTVEGEPEKKISLLVQDAPETEYFTLGAPVFNNEEVIAFGANLSKKKGFIFGFDQGRYSKWSLEYDLPGEEYRLTADTVPAAAGSLGFYLLNEAVEENNLSVTSFNQAGALNWTIVITVPKAPVDFKFDEITQELTILLYPEEDLPLDNDELGYLVIDRTGNAR
jgi:hypothetical protein